jgi:transposase-like protein
MLLMNSLMPRNMNGSGERKGYLSGHYSRNFQTTSGEVTLKMPKLKGIQFETAILSDIAGENVLSRKRLLKCILLVFGFAV